MADFLSQSKGRWIPVRGMPSAVLPERMVGALTVKLAPNCYISIGLFHKRHTYAAVEDGLGNICCYRWTGSGRIRGPQDPRVVQLAYMLKGGRHDSV